MAFISINNRNVYGNSRNQQDDHEHEYLIECAHQYSTELKRVSGEPQGPLSHILMTWGGGPTEVHILYPKKFQLQNLSTQKNPYFFLANLKKSFSVFASANFIIYLVES